MANGLFATKPMEVLLREAETTSEHGLKRALGPINLVTLGIGAIIGTGIFTLTGVAAARFPDPPSCCPSFWPVSVAFLPAFAMQSLLR